MMGKQKWTIQNSVDSEGLLAVIFCWYSGECDEHENRWEFIGKLITKIPVLIDEMWEEFSGDEIFFIWDALGSYPEKDQVLNELYDNIMIEKNERSE